MQHVPQLFIKYQSLGNDFILFDWQDKPQESIAKQMADRDFTSLICHLCDRHFGIGADSVLILTHNQHKNLPEFYIYNADGSRAELCLNGLRSIAHYLHAQNNKLIDFDILISSRTIHCTVHMNAQNTPEIVTAVPLIQQKSPEPLVAHISQASFTGYAINVGNPHFIIFEQTTPEWLDAYGKLLEQHELFPQKTNVEFMWQQEPNTYNVLVYERGCGRTLACGSGALAITTLLYAQEKIKSGQKITLSMQGGPLTCWVEDGQVYLQAQAQLVFTGVI